jgi:hypothetical protein
MLAACNTGTGRAPGLVPRSDAGASSGIAASRLVSSLTPAEARTLCEYTVAVAGGPPPDCGGAPTFSPTSVDDCAASIGVPPAGCLATVGDVEACMRTVGATPCTAFASDACAPILACGH